MKKQKMANRKRPNPAWPTMQKIWQASCEDLVCFIVGGMLGELFRPVIFPKKKAPTLGKKKMRKKEIAKSRPRIHRRTIAAT